jgi:hypothetical protein
MNVTSQPVEDRRRQTPPARALAAAFAADLLPLAAAAALLGSAAAGRPLLARWAGPTAGRRLTTVWDSGCS